MAENQGTWLAANIRALADPRNANLRESLSASVCGDHMRINWEKAKLKDAAVPVVTLDTGMRVALHSRYDPLTESIRTAKSIEPASLLVILGIGAGYLVEACRTRMHEEQVFDRILAIEPNGLVFTSCLATCDVSVLLEDSRITMAWAPDQEAMCGVISRIYLPHFFPTIRIVVSPAQRQMARKGTQDPELWLNAQINAIQGDFLTQSRLGKRWLYNLVCNAMGTGPVQLPPPREIEECLVIGAGPSLEYQVPAIKKLQARGVTTIVCDASLAYCRYHEIQIDQVMSIDGQSISYLHLLSGGLKILPGEGKVVMDLCAHPGYARHHGTAFLGGSDHPLINWLRLVGVEIPVLDCKGGNVGGSMVAWGTSQGARLLHVFGLDFAYLNGQPYVRPSFFHDDAMAKADRLSPFSHRLASLYIGDTLDSSSHPQGTVVMTPRLRVYHQAFLEFAAKTKSRMLRYWGPGEPDTIVEGQPGSGAMPIGFPKTGPKTEMVDGLRMYAKALGYPGLDGIDPLQIWESGSPEQQALLITLAPCMAWEMANILQSGKEITDISKQAYRLALVHTRKLLARFLE